MLPSPMRALGRRFKENSPDELHVAVLTGRIKKIKHLVKKGVHIESVNPQGQTPLFSASFGGDYEVVKVLLRLGANPNRRCGSAGAAPIHAASYRGSRRVLRALVEAGGDLNLRDAELRTPRDYALKQPSPLRRQKILSFLDLLFTMTLHRMAANLPQTGTLPSMAGLPEGGSNAGTLKGQRLKKGFFGGSQLSLSRKSSYQSTASVWSSCVSEASSSHPSPDDVDTSKTKEIVLTPNLHKSVSCHLLDQLCVTTSLPLLSPAQLQRPPTPTTAYTCGGPTVYSSFSWLGTPVTVRRPTPALAISKQGAILKESVEGGTPDQEAVRALLHELAFLRRLRHPGFLEVMAACHVTHPSPDHVTLVYQHVLHGSLYHHLHVQHHDLSVGSAVDILIGLVEALLFMHAHGWFHGGLSSHALHLVSLGNAKLGSFEHAFERHVKGVGLRAEHLSKVAWLRPWQAPEVIMERMVSVRSEVYSVSTIIWEIWAGMPPWAGVEEGEVSKRISKGETLPPLKGLNLSLVSYLTEYGLKWNDHERELDLQEVHTMLRSLRIQCNEEERVPPVTSWGPPSIPNTPVIGRHRDQLSSRPGSSLNSTSSSSGELRDGKKSFRHDPILGIKPASHQLTRHSSSCTLASGPSSPTHTTPTSVTLLGSSGNRKLANSQDSLPTSPRLPNSPLPKYRTMPSSSRSLSVFNDRGFLLADATTPSAKAHLRRHSDIPKRSRRLRRKQEMEFEEEFIDDEFDANIYDQPHMQLSVGSSENLLDNRLTYSLVHDSASSASLSSRSSHHSRHVTSSEDDEGDVTKGPRWGAAVAGSSRSAPMKALEETGDSDNDDKKVKTKTPKLQSSTEDHATSSSKSEDVRKKTTSSSSSSSSESEADEDVFSKESSLRGDDPFPKEFEPLMKSSRALRTLEKSFSNYLPIYSIGSDTEGSGDP